MNFKNPFASKQKSVTEDFQPALQMATQCGFSIEHFDKSREYFGNVVLIISKNDLLLRFVRDRGFATCEIGGKNDPNCWHDCDLAARGIIAEPHSFCDVVQKVLSSYGE